jgi:CheY-like chemotaxis protein
MTNNMQKVLIIDDDEEMLNDLEKSFTESGIFVTKCLDWEKALLAIDNAGFDAIILDWYFVIPESSKISIEILKKLNNKHFKPVFIYTGHKLDYESTGTEEFEFPKNLITVYDKSDITVDKLLERIKQLSSENITVQIASIYRKSISENFEKILFDINQPDSNDLEKILHIIYGEKENIDWSSDFILNLIHRFLISDQEFTKELKLLLARVNNTNHNNDNEYKKRILSKILYFNSETDLIRNGDIVSWKKSDNSSNYGIVVTPDCDLENKKTRFIEIIELRQFNNDLNLNHGDRERIRNNNDPSHYLFPSLKIDNDTFIDFIALFKAKQIIAPKTDPNEDNSKYPTTKNRLSYSQTFLFDGQEINVEMICSYINPYKSEFMQKLHAHNSRVGIPDIKDMM